MPAPHTSLFIILIFVCVSVPVAAREFAPVTGAATAVSPAISTSEILPLQVRPEKDSTLRAISVTQRSSEGVLDRERVAYSSIRERWVNASSIERTELQPMVIEQRHRLLMAVLNRVTAIYQRMDMIISTFDTTLLRLRFLHDKRTNPIPDFDARYQSLSSDLTALHAQSDSAAKEITACQRNVSLSDCVRSSRDHTAQLLGNLRTFFASYRSLALDVVSP